MAAAITDKFTSATNSSRPSPTTLTAIHSGGGTTMTCNALTGWPTDTAVHFIIYTTDTSGNKVAGSQTDWKGVVSGSTITGCVLKAGTDSGYSIGAIVEAAPTAYWAKDLADGLQVEHDQDGTHSAITASSVTATTGTFTNLTVSGTATSQGWTPLGDVPDTVTANGNRNYDIVFNGVDHTSTLSPGMKLQLTRTVAAPDQCTDLEAGSSQYYSKTSPSGMTFTDDYTCSAWVKLESYTAGGIIARRNGDTEGWSFGVNSNGTVQLTSLRIAGNNSVTVSYASLPLNKWIHVAASADLSGTTTTIYFDGVVVSSLTTVTGTCTALVQGTTALVVGAEKSAGTNPFDGKIAQVAVYSAVLSAATIKNSMDRTLSGSETSLISAYSFDNSINDLNANANNLTANGSAVATATDSPFANAVAAGLLEYAEVNSVTFSTNTTVNVRVPDTCQIPTTGGVSAVSYSTQSNPYGLPYFSKVIGYALLQADTTTTATSVTAALGFSITAYIPTNAKIRISFYSGGVYNSTTNQCRVSVWDGTVGSGTALIGGLNGNDSGQVIPFSMSNTLTPASGSKTYNVGFYGTGAGTTYISSSSTVPAYLQVELV